MSNVQTADGTDRCFLKATYSYRQWPAVVVLGLIGTLDLLVVADVIANPRQLNPTPARLFGIVAGSLWLVSTSVVVGLCGWRIVFRPLVDTCIDSEGIRIDGKLTPWKLVRAIYGRRVQTLLQGQRISLHYLKRGPLPLSLILHVPINPLTEDEYQDLIDRLDGYLEQAHPGVSVGS